MSMNIFSMSLQIYNFSENLKRGCTQNYHLIHYEITHNKEYYYFSQDRGVLNCFFLDLFWNEQQM